MKFWSLCGGVGIFCIVNETSDAQGMEVEKLISEEQQAGNEKLL